MERLLILMTLFDLLQFAWRALTGHRLRTILCTIGVGIGVTSVILLTSLGEGGRIYVTGELATLGSSLIVVLPGKIETKGMVPLVGGVPNDLTLTDAEAIQHRVPSAKMIAPLTIGQSVVSHESLSRNVTVIGTSYEFLHIRRLSIARGSYLPRGEFERASPVCVIGTRVEQELFRGANPLGQILRIGDWRFRIIGVIAPKGESMGFNIDDSVMIPVALAMKVYDQTTLFRIFVETAAYEDLNASKEKIIEVIKERHDNEEDITLLTQDSVLASFNNIFTALTLALAGIAAISLSVAGVGIMNVMLVSVSERTSEIGLLKAIGVKPSQIVSVFLAEASLLSILGGIVGLCTALLLVDLIGNIFPAFPITIPSWAIISSVVVAIFVGLLFGVWPARRASRLDPIQALTRR
jgi:putative ABC transport system permease protein